MRPMPWPRAHRPTDEGSIAMLTIGIVAVVLMVVVTVAAATHVQLQRARLSHAADEVALAAADALDLDTYYGQRAVQLSPAALTQEARAQFEASGLRTGLEDAAIASALTPDGTSVSVTLVMRTPLLFDVTWLPGQVALRATAQAQAAP